MSAAEQSAPSTSSDVDERLATAKKDLQAGRFAEAERDLLDLVDLEPDPATEAECHYMLAVARRYQGNHDAALTSIDNLVSLRPDYGRGYQERGYVHLATNDAQAALDAFAQAVSLNPGLAASWKSLIGLYAEAGQARDAEFAQAQYDYLAALPRELAGVIDLIHEGRLLKAERLCRHFLQQNGHHIEAMRLLADIGIRLRIYDDAEFLLESAVELAPGNIRARGDYVKILNRKGKFNKALEQARILNEQQPENPAWQLGMASALNGLGEIDEAIALFKNSLGRVANKPGVQVMLGHALKARGDFDEAIHAYRSAFEQKPDYGDAYWSLANTKTYRFSDAELERLREQEAASGVGEDDSIHLSFALGKALEDRGEHEASFAAYRRGNRAKAERNGYDPAITSAAVDRQIDTCNASLFEEQGGHGSDRPDPIFVVGLPRAGSTLIEQILASHSKVDGTMELHEIPGLAQRLNGRGSAESADYPGILREIDSSYFARFGQKYLDDTEAYRGDAPFFVDKMPNNFLHVGLIRLILPNARIIDARRHPMACGFSCYKQLFGEGQDFSYGLESIGCYYRDYVRLMNHWDEVLPGFVLRVAHEDVIEDLEAQVRRILDFCGLPFEESCLDFHKTERSIKTPSSEQVRQPIYRSGMDQWRNYENWLSPLKASLGEDIRREFAIY